MINLNNGLYTTSIDSATIDPRVAETSVRCISPETSNADMDKKADKKLVSFRLPEDLLQELRERADKDTISVTELVCRLLKQGLQASTDDQRIAALEAEIKDLRKQYKQVNFSSISPVPVYSPVFPQNAIAHESDPETKQRIAALEAQMKEGVAGLEAMMQMKEGIAKLEAMMEEVLASQDSESSQSKHAQDSSRRGGNAA